MANHWNWVYRAQFLVNIAYRTSYKYINSTSLKFPVKIYHFDWLNQKNCLRKSTFFRFVILMDDFEQLHTRNPFTEPVHFEFCFLNFILKTKFFGENFCWKSFRFENFQLEILKDIQNLIILFWAFYRWNVYLEVDHTDKQRNKIY